MKNSDDLILFHKNMDYTVHIFELCKLMPESETFGLIMVLKKTAIKHVVKFRRLLDTLCQEDQLICIENARTSIFKILTLLEISLRLKYINQNDFDDFEQLSEALIKIFEEKIIWLNEEIDNSLEEMKLLLSRDLESFDLPGDKIMES